MSAHSKEYEHHISPEVFVEAITATDEEFHKRADEYRELGIKRIEVNSLKMNFKYLRNLNVQL